MASLSTIKRTHIIQPTVYIIKLFVLYCIYFNCMHGIIRDGMAAHYLGNSWILHVLTSGRVATVYINYFIDACLHSTRFSVLVTYLNFNIALGKDS